MNNTEVQIRVWRKIKGRAMVVKDHEPMLSHLYNESIIEHESFKDSICTVLAHKLASRLISAEDLKLIIHEALANNESIISEIAHDIEAVVQRDPAVHDDYLIPFLYFKGVASLITYRVAHYFWQAKRYDISRLLQTMMSDRFAMDIHPAAIIGKGIMLDHGTGIVIGETCVIEDNVSIMQEVTLGGTGKEQGDRHPKVGYGVMIGAGAKILGNIKIGKCSKIGAGSVVLEDVPVHSTVVGVPARVVGKTKSTPSLFMEQSL